VVTLPKIEVNVKPVRPMILAGDIDPTDEVVDRPLIPTTSAGLIDPTDRDVDNPVGTIIGFVVIAILPKVDVTDLPSNPIA
jgi:hypothetical protein